MKKPNPALTDHDNPEWSEPDFAQARPAHEIFPELANDSQKRGRGQRGPQKMPLKKAISLRIDADVLAKYKATGRLWQYRMNTALRKAAKAL
ncbi:MAG: BrnA antitoxin family protein [Candidatus Binataceae bacterium]